MWAWYAGAVRQHRPLNVTAAADRAIAPRCAALLLLVTTTGRSWRTLATAATEANQMDRGIADIRPVGPRQSRREAAGLPSDVSGAVVRIT